MGCDNEISVTMSAIPQNEGFARVCAASFVSQLNPTLAELNDIKTAVSEAVTNAIIHGYADFPGVVTLNAGLNHATRELYIEVIDNGVGIDDIETAITPLYTSKPEMERSGMGFTVMEEFMDRLEIVSESGRGTTIKLWKRL